MRDRGSINAYQIVPRSRLLRRSNGWSRRVRDMLSFSVDVRFGAAAALPGLAETIRRAGRPGRKRNGCFAAIDGEKQTFADRADGRLLTTKRTFDRRPQCVSNRP